MMITFRILFQREKQKNMNEKHGKAFVDDPPSTQAEDWNNAVVSHSMTELQAVAQHYKQVRKEQVSVAYSPEVLAYFRATGTGWQTRMDEVLRHYVVQHTL